MVLQFLWLLLAREEWEVGPNRLEIRRRLLGFSWGSQHRDGELLLEANYRKDEARPFWQLAVNSDGRKRYLIREGAISDHGTAIGFKPSRKEVETIAHDLDHVCCLLCRRAVRAESIRFRRVGDAMKRTHRRRF